MEPHKEQHVEMENYAEGTRTLWKTGEWHPVGKAFAALFSLGITAGFGVGEGENVKKTRMVQKVEGLLDQKSLHVKEKNR